MNYAEAVAALDARTNFEAGGMRLVAPTLERMRALCDLLGNPERTSPVIHITGTNGKTTTALLASRLLLAAGLTAGTSTSPHLQTPRERVRVNGEPIGEAAFAAGMAYLEPFFAQVDERGSAVTWFEAMTALAFTHFADVAVEAQVLEVGMGGTWDATNVADAQVAVITSVALDHTKVLGSTPGEIAAEKVGIVKPGSIVICGERDPDVLAVVRGRCEDAGADLRLIGEDFALERADLAVGGQRLVVRSGDARFDDVLLPMFGERIATDAAIAIAAVHAFLGDRDLDAGIVHQALDDASSPGRMEVAGRNPLVVLDGAHNVAAAGALANAVTASFRFGRLILVAGMLGDKDVEGVLGALAPLAAEAIVAPVDWPRTAEPDRLRAALETFGVKVTTVASISDAIGAALASAAEDDCILVAGSLYTVGEARDALGRR